MAYTLSSSLSSVPTGGAVTRDAGGRVYINDTITLQTGAVVDAFYRTFSGGVLSDLVASKQIEI